MEQFFKNKESMDAYFDKHPEMIKRIGEIIRVEETAWIDFLDSSTTEFVLTSRGKQYNINTSSLSNNFIIHGVFSNAVNSIIK